MRTPNAECCICGKPLYRRPYELAKVRHVACMEHRGLAQAQSGITEAQRAGLALGSVPGTNHRTGYVHREESKRKASESHKAWCAANPDKVKARSEKTRGNKHYKWNGGSSRLNTAIRRLTHRRWMDTVVRRDGKCSVCGASDDLEAHHVKPFAEIVSDNRITTLEQARQCADLWDLSNGVTLCERCHCIHHDRKYTPVGNGRRKQPRKVRRSMGGTANPNYQGGKASLTCPQCDTVFLVKQAEIGKRKFCSRRCFGESQRKAV